MPKLTYQGQMETDVAVYYCPYGPDPQDELEIFWAEVERKLAETNRRTKCPIRVLESSGSILFIYPDGHHLDFRTR